MPDTSKTIKPSGCYSPDTSFVVEWLRPSGWSLRIFCPPQVWLKPEPLVCLKTMPQFAQGLNHTRKFLSSSLFWECPRQYQTVSSTTSRARYPVLTISATGCHLCSFTYCMWLWGWLHMRFSLLISFSMELWCYPHSSYGISWLSDMFTRESTFSLPASHWWPLLVISGETSYDGSMGFSKTLH